LTVAELNPATGQPTWQVQAAGVWNGAQIVYCYGNGDAPEIATRNDGAVIISEPTNNGFPRLTLVQPNGGVELFSIPDSTSTVNGSQISVQCCMGPPMANEDGMAYVEYEVRNIGDTGITSDNLYLFQINPDNSTSSTLLSSTTDNEALLPGPIVPDGQGGVVATWTISPSNPPVPQYPYQAADVTGGSVGAPYNLPFSPKTVSPGQFPTIVLGQNGTAFASGPTTSTDGNNTALNQVVSFNIGSGAPNWLYQTSSQDTLSILSADADGGVAINDLQNGVLQLGAAGNSTQITAPLGGSPQYGWGGNWYLANAQGASLISPIAGVDAAGIWATPGGSPSHGNSTAALCSCLLQTDDPGDGSLARPALMAEGSHATDEPRAAAAPGGAPTNCIICSLSPPPSPNTTSCTTFPGTGATYLILVGDGGLQGHDVGNLFNLAAQQAANDLQTQGNKVIACRVSSIQNFNAAMTQNGLITGDLLYFGHSGLRSFSTQPPTYASLLFVGQATGDDTNIAAYNITVLCDSTAGCNIDNYLSANTAIRINGCDAGYTIGDYYSHGKQTSIAQILSNQLRRGVYAYAVGMYFSHLDASQDPYVDGRDPINPKKSRYVSSNLPMYLIPEGTPGNKPSAIPFTPQ